MIYPCRKIFVVLGTACNMGCRYCIQHPIIHEKREKAVNPDLIRWLDAMADVKKGKLDICFFGGEPLLYFDAIKEIVEQRRSGNLRYSIITNGRAMTQEIAEFMNAHRFRAAVSWDGENVKRTRGYDVFDPALPHRNILLGLDKLCLTGVVTSENYPRGILKAMQDIDDEYFKLHGCHVSVNLDFLFGERLPDPALADVSYGRVRREVCEILREYDGYLHGGKADACIINWLAPYLTRFYEGKHGYPYCMNGWKILNVDLSGNLYLCHNAGKVIGHISMPSVRYVEKARNFGDEERRRTLCEACPVYKLCGQYCKLVNEDHGEERYCRLRREALSPVITYFETGTIKEDS